MNLLFTNRPGCTFIEKSQLHYAVSKRGRPGRVICVATLVAATLALYCAKADKIGVNFVGGRLFSDPWLAPSDVAGYVPQAHWNNAMGPSGALSLQGDTNGPNAANYAGLTVTWSGGSGTWDTGNASAAGNNSMMNGYLDGLAPNTSPGLTAIAVTVTNIPTRVATAGYAVIVYFDCDNGNYFEVNHITLNADNYGTRGVFGQDAPGANFSGTFTQVPSSSTTDLGASTPAGNFVVFSGVYDTEFNLIITPGSNNDVREEFINGFQIVDLQSLPAPPPPFLTSGTSAIGTVTVPFSFTVTANNSPDHFGASGLPPGLSINPNTGLISGTPVAAGVFSVNLSATNTGGVGTALLTLSIGSGVATSPAISGTTNSLTSGSVIDSNNLLTGGDDGMLLTSTNGGQSWRLINVGLTNGFECVRGIGSYEFVAGAFGLIAMSADYGASWTMQPTGVTNALYSLSFLTPFWGYAVGAGGTICFWNGVQWLVQPSGTSSDFYAVAAIESTAYAVGNHGSIYRFENTNWVALNSSTPSATFYGVSFLNPNFGYVVGSSGTICQTTNGGVSWTTLNSGTGVTLRGIVVADLSTAWAVGDNGVFLQTTDSGAHWSQIPLGLSADLLAIDFLFGRGILTGAGGLIYTFGQINYPINQSPRVSLVEPTNGIAFWPCTRVPFYATAYDTDGYVSKIELFLGSAKIGEHAGGKFAYVWTNETMVGRFSAVAKATDNFGATAFSAPVDFTVELPPKDQLIALGVWPTNAFEFCLCGLTDRVYFVQTSTNLLNWTPWQTVTNRSGVTPMVDPSIGPSAKRFYRAVPQ